MLRLIKSAADGTLGHHRRNLYQIYMMFMREGGLECHIGIRYVVHLKGKTKFLKIKVRKGEWKEIQIQILLCNDLNILKNLLSHLQT